MAIFTHVTLGTNNFDAAVTFYDVDSSSKCNNQWLFGVAYFHPEEYLMRRSKS